MPAVVAQDSDSGVRTEAARQQMIHQQVRAWEVLDERVLRLFERVPREQFVPQALQSLAFADTEIPLGGGVRMLSPKMVGRILQAVDTRPAERVLEIGTGSGFLTACISLQASQVSSLEIRADLAAAAAGRLQQFGAVNALVRHADVYAPGELQASRYDVVVLTGSLPQADERFQQQLNVGGRLFVVVGQPPVMEARLVQRVSEARFSTTALFETQLAPLQGAVGPESFRF